MIGYCQVIDVHVDFECLLECLEHEHIKSWL